MFTPAAKKIMDHAFEEANGYGHPEVTPEHILLGLLQDDSVCNALAPYEADIDALHAILHNHLLKRPVFQRQARKCSTLATQIVNEAKGSRVREENNPLKLLHCLLTIGKQTYAAKILRNYGVSAADIERRAMVIRKGGKNIQLYCKNLNQMAADDEIPMAIGRDADLEKIIKTLSRKNKSNALIIADSGTGKTVTAESLARMIVNGQVPAHMNKAQVFSLNMEELFAFSDGHGDIEDRFKNVLEEIEDDPHAILLIDDIHTMSENTLSLLKPALARGRFHCIATTSYKDFRAELEKNQSLMRLFIRHEMKEPNAAETLKIVSRSIAQYEFFHKVRYSRDAVESAVRLADRFIQGKKMPDKVFDLIDQAGAAKYLEPGRQSARRLIRPRDIEKIVAEMTGIPASALDQDEESKLDKLESDLKSVVMGQDKAAHTLARAIRRSKAGLNDPNKPIGCFLFQGPTGVGKTEITRKLGEILGMKVERFDMSEYMEKHSVARMIGAPPGYVGFDQGGLLTGAVDKTPHLVVLIDEIEKAHPDLYNILLQIMDHGKLTDNTGKQVDFRNVILIMTTNAGSSNAAEVKVGIGAGGNNEQAHIDESIKRLFSPEFRNRLDEIVPFSHLDKPTVAGIAKKFLGELGQRLGHRNVTLEWTESAQDWLVQKGYNRQYGARPMARLIQTSIADKLADEILGGRLKKGGHVSIDFNREAGQDGQTSPALSFSFESASSDKASVQRRKPANQNRPAPKADMA